MKKGISILATTTLLAISLLFYSCKKDISKHAIKNDLQERVSLWLDQQKNSKQPNKAANIDLLKRNLDYAGLKYESFNDGEQLIIIPVKEEFKSAKCTHPHSIPVLVLTDDKRHIIKNGRIAIFKPETDVVTNGIPANTFSKVLNMEPVSSNGLFELLSVTGQLLHKFDYKNGKINSFAELKPQVAAHTGPGTTSRTNDNCIDWYIVTTYYLDGLPVHQESQYVGTTCDGCDHSELESICPDGGGGPGSDGGSDEITTITVSATREEDDETDAAAGVAPKIRYQYTSLVTKTNGIVTGVFVYPTTIANPHEIYVDRYGRNTTRTLTVFGHSNSWTSLGTTAMVYWSCYVYGRWIYTDGSPEYNRNWLNTHSAIR